MAEIAGKNARVAIDASGNWPGGFGIAFAFFRISSATFKSGNEPYDHTNSEGTPGNPAATAAHRGFRSKLGTPTGGEVTLKQLTFDSTTSNPFLAPFILFDGAYVNVRIFPAWDVDPTRWHHFPSLLVKDISGEIDISAGEPVTISFDTDGAYAFWVTADIVF
jgi:hypothetical protein